MLTFGSLQISDSQSPFSISPNTSAGPSVPAAEASAGSSQEVTKLGTPRGKKAFPNDNETLSQCHSGGGGQGIGSARSRGKSQELLGLVQVNKLSGLLVLMEARRIQQEGKPS
ncbi:hypothetical protein GBA52_028526 [Prunus armeniaca]|nr:hypothetical protein GBA52_028526 [Prunus armeniaca]